MYANKKSAKKKNKISPDFITMSLTPLVTFIGGKRKIQPTELPGFLNPRLLY